MPLAMTPTRPKTPAPMPARTQLRPGVADLGPDAGVRVVADWSSVLLMAAPVAVAVSGTDSCGGTTLGAGGAAHHGQPRVYGCCAGEPCAASGPWGGAAQHGRSI